MTLPLAEAPPWIDAKSALSGHQAAPLFSVKRGRAVMLTLTNSAPKNSGIGFAVHLHGHHARLLDNLDDGWKPYWLDTVVVTAGQTARIVFVADNPGKWLIELQSFASHSAVTWFEVT
jgi:FtsP/CotA-like multicopper oxidase with cupredoxin domain